MDKNIMKMITTLGIIAVIVAFALANVFKITEPLIKENHKRITEKAIREVLPKIKRYTKSKVNGVTIYTGFDKDGKKLGFAFISIGSGYQGKINIMAGIDKNLEKLTGIYIMEQVETPGLGGRISEKTFQKQFRGVNVKTAIEYVKNKEPSKDNEVKAITGATISSRSVIRNLNDTLAKIKRGLKSG